MGFPKTQKTQSIRRRAQGNNLAPGFGCHTAGKKILKNWDTGGYFFAILNFEF
jgi:hypothetical protein